MIGGPVDPGSSVTRGLASAIVVAGLWLAILALNGTRKKPIVGSGEEEYRLVTRATLQTFGLLAIASFLVDSFATDLDTIRVYVLLAMPVGLVVLPLGRRWCRRSIERRVCGASSGPRCSSSAPNARWMRWSDRSSATPRPDTASSVCAPPGTRGRAGAPSPSPDRRSRYSVRKPT